MSFSQVHVILTVIWTASIFLAACPLLGWNRYVSEVSIDFPKTRSDLNVFFFLSQAYLAGCSFDAFSTSWQSRSYIVTLVVVAWFLPMTCLCACYFRIFYSVRDGLLRWTEIPNAAEEQRRRVGRIA